MCPPALLKTSGNENSISVLRCSWWEPHSLCSSMEHLWFCNFCCNSFSAAAEAVCTFAHLLLPDILLHHRRGKAEFLTSLHKVIGPMQGRPWVEALHAPGKAVDKPMEWNRRGYLLLAHSSPMGFGGHCGMFYWGSATGSCAFHSRHRKKPLKSVWPFIFFPLVSSHPERHRALSAAFRMVRTSCKHW